MNSVAQASQECYQVTKRVEADVIANGFESLKEEEKLVGQTLDLCRYWKSLRQFEFWMHKDKTKKGLLALMQRADKLNRYIEGRR